MICNSCGLDKPLEDYYRDKIGYVRKECKECVIKKQSKYAAKHKEKLKDYHKEYYKNCYKEKQTIQRNDYKEKINKLKTPCKKCGESRLYCIDFHHIEPQNKEFNINRKHANKNFSIIENEVAKCVCLCRNCHSEFHYIYGSIPNSPIENLKEYLGG